MNSRNFLNSRIIASLTLEKLVGQNKYEAVRTGITFDVTEAILNMRLRDIRSLVDDTDPVNDLIAYFDGWDALNHQGPSKLEVTGAVAGYFGVEDLADIKRDMLVAARQALQAGKAMAVAHAVMAACKSSVEKGRSLDGLDLSAIVERTLREQTSVGLLVEQVNAELAVLRTALSEPQDVRYSPSLTLEVTPAEYGDRLAVSRTTRGQTTVEYTDDGLSVDVYNQEGSEHEPLQSVRLNRADLEGKMYELQSPRQ
ncbi:hypothetical protein [Paraburkholderia youngii]|uniref:hypothetical protein n=1 Tax=Paraburkholderia youngii TaxID=2782701 RepID=UPI003D1FC7D0